MNTATLTIRVNPSVKSAALSRASELNISVSSVLNNTLKKFARGDDVVIEGDELNLKNYDITAAEIDQKLAEAEKVAKNSRNWESGKPMFKSLRAEYGL